MATVQNLYIEQGTDVEVNIALTGVDISGFTARSQFRTSHLSNTSYQFECTVTSANTLRMEMTSNTSALVPPGRYFYDVEVVSPAHKVSRIVEGLVTVSAEMTK